MRCIYAVRVHTLYTHIPLREPLGSPLGSLWNLVFGDLTIYEEEDTCHMSPSTTALRPALADAPVAGSRQAAGTHMGYVEDSYEACLYY
jgi:hypothetical protein